MELDLKSTHFTPPLGIDMLRMSNAAITVQISNLFSTRCTKHVTHRLRHATQRFKQSPLDVQICALRCNSKFKRSGLDELRFLDTQTSNLNLSN